MAGNTVAKKTTGSPAGRALASATAEVMTKAARNAAGEIAKGDQPLRDIAKTVAADAVDDIEKRGPGLAKEAGILTWRYAALGWLTWNVGKRVIRRKAKKAVTTRTKGAKTNA